MKTPKINLFSPKGAFIGTPAGARPGVTMELAAWREECKTLRGQVVTLRNALNYAIDVLVQEGFEKPDCDGGFPSFMANLRAALAATAATKDLEARHE